MLGLQKLTLIAIAVTVLTGCGPQSAREDATSKDESTPSPAEPILLISPKSDTPAPFEAAPAQEKTATTPGQQQPANPDLPGMAPKPPTKKAVENLIENGNFRDWPDPVRVPKGWTHCLGYPRLPEMPSSILPLWDASYEGQMAVKQTWRRSDGADSVFRQFGVTVTNLKPNTKYVIKAKAHNQSDSPVLIVPYGVVEEGEKVQRLAEGGVLVKPGNDFEVCSTGFVTAEQTTVRLAAASTVEEESAYPLTVVWEEWVLLEMREDKADAQ
jgi:hypothetical protein